MAKSILKTAEEYCMMHKHRFTQPRQEVLKIVSMSHKPLGAYEILDQLGKVIENPKPPTAYRAIEFWQEHGFIHRIESLNAYVVCEAGHQHKGSQFMICDGCEKVTEAHMCDLPEELQSMIETKGFEAQRWNIELHGTCDLCRENS